MCGALLYRSRSIEPTLAGHDHPFSDVAKHRVGRTAERPPGARAARALPLLPYELTAQQQTKVVLKDADHIGGETPVRLTPQIRHIHCNSSAWLELSCALREDRREHIEILEIRRWDAL